MIKATSCFKNFFMEVLKEKDYITGMFYNREYVTEVIISTNYVEINNYERALDGRGWKILSEKVIQKRDLKLYNSVLNTFINWCFKDFEMFAGILMTGTGRHFK